MLSLDPQTAESSNGKVKIQWYKYQPGKEYQIQRCQTNCLSERNVGLLLIAATEK